MGFSWFKGNGSAGLVSVEDGETDGMLAGHLANKVVLNERSTGLEEDRE